MSVPESVRLSVGDVLVSSQYPCFTAEVVEVRRDGSVMLLFCTGGAYWLSRKTLANEKCLWTQLKGAKQ